MRSGRRVLRSVLRPVRVDPHYARGAKSVFVVGRALRHHGWANPREWEEPTLGLDVRAQRGSPRVTALAREAAWLVEKRKEVEASVPARIKSPGWLLARRVSLQKSAGDLWSRIRSAYALQKERSGSSERGPSSESRSAGETVGKGVERRERRESASPPKTGEVRRKAQGGARASSSGHDIAKSGAVVVGPGL